MYNNNSEIIKCIEEIKSLRQIEEQKIEYLLSMANAHPIEITEDEITKIFGAPLAICDGCRHWNGSICDILRHGCNYET